MLFQIHDTARIVRDVEVRYTQGGTAVSSTAIVKSRKWKDKDSGELMEEACFIDIVAFAKTAEFLNQYFRKGDLIEFNGELQQDKWEDKDGNKRSKHTIKITTIEFGPCKKSESGHTPKEPSERGTPANYGQQNQQSGQQQANYQAPEREAPQIPEIDINEDEIPF